MAAKRRRRCGTCGQEGHNARNCPKGTPRRYRCGQCGQEGHTKRGCVEVSDTVRARAEPLLLDMLSDGHWPTGDELGAILGINPGAARRLIRRIVSDPGSQRAQLGGIIAADYRAASTPISKTRRGREDGKEVLLWREERSPEKPHLAVKILLAMEAPPPEPPDIVAYVAGRLDRPPLTDAQAKVKEMIDARRADVESAG